MNNLLPTNASFIHFSSFKNITSTDPLPVDMSLEDLQAYLNAPESLESKIKAEKIFSFVRYKAGVRRGNEGILSITAIVLDFDFKAPLPEKGLKGADKILSILAVSGLQAYKHFWYTTFSFKETHPNFRLILALEEEMTPDTYKQALPQIIDAFKDHKPDTCSKALAQVYFGPAINIEKSFDGEPLFYHGSDLDKPYLNIEAYLPPAKLGNNQQTALTCAKSQTNHQQRYRQALELIHPDLPYDQWIQVGMALYKEFGPSSGFTLWDSWSKKGTKYQHNKSNEMQAHWKSFATTKLDGGMLVNLAKEYGFDTKTTKNNSKVVFLNPTTGEITDVEVVEEEDLPPELADVHHAFQDWEDFDQADIYDLKKWPLLHWLEQQFLANCDAKRHDMRLASVISVAGHILREVYNAPEKTHFYTLSVMPTGVGKNKFFYTTRHLLSHFNLSKQRLRNVGSVQALFKHLIQTDCKLFHSVDEISETIHQMKSHGNANVFRIKVELKELFSALEYEVTAYKNSDDSVPIFSNPFASLYWIGTEFCFEHFEESDFTTGLLNRFLLFLTRSRGETGVKSQDLKKQKQPIRLVGSPDIQYNFGDVITFEAGFNPWYDRFIDLVNTKCLLLPEGDIREHLLARAGEHLTKLSALTCDATGHVSLEGAKWACSVVIASLKAFSYVTDKYYQLDYATKDVREVSTRIQHLVQQQEEQGRHQSQDITLTLLLRSLKKLSRKRIEEALERLKGEGTIEMREAQNKQGSPSQMITLLRTPPKLTSILNKKQENR